jgi:hypothetical protein
MGLTRKDPPRELSGPTGYQVPYLYDATIPRHWRGLPDISGTNVAEAEYDDIGILLSNAIAHPASDDTATPAFSHVFTLTAAKPADMPASLTCGDVSGPEDLQFAGCHINVLEISGSPDRLVHVSTDLVGQRGGDATVADAADDFSAVPWIEYSDADLLYNSTVSTVIGSMTSQTSGAEAMDWSFRLENNLLIRGGTGQGGRYIREPIYSGYRRATMTFTRDYLDTQWFDHLMSALEGATPGNSYVSAAIKMTSLEMVTGAIPYSLLIEFPFALVESGPVEYGGNADVEAETITLVAATDGSEAPCTVTLVNGTDNLAGQAYKGTQT